MAPPGHLRFQRYKELSESMELDEEVARSGAQCLYSGRIAVAQDHSCNDSSGLQIHIRSSLCSMMTISLSTAWPSRQVRAFRTKR